jgi:hypothetical protein
MQSSPYTPVWHKYRPAILRLMVDSSQEPQHYPLSAHEFKALNPRQKGGYDFSLHVSRGRAVNNIRESEVARGLLYILQLSPKGSAMMEEGDYEIKLDKQFVLHVEKLQTETAT